MDFIRNRALQGEFLAGGWCNLASPLSSEIVASLGYDWILLDQEHGPGDNWTLLHQTQAAARFSGSIVVRIPWVDRIIIKRTLDLGVGGIMVPYVQTSEEAREVVRLAKYTPMGERGIAGAPRCMTFGSNFPEYFANANDNLITVVQIETPTSVENAEAIAAVPGVDVLFIGPLDLAISSGLRGMYEDPVYMKKLAQVVSAAKNNGKAAGILANGHGIVPELKKMGFTFVACGSDSGCVSSAMAATLKVLRN